MKPLYFFTGNQYKYNEAVDHLPRIMGRITVKPEIDEIQSLDLRKVIENKLEGVIKSENGSRRIIVEDTSLVLVGMNGLPGPFVKYFEETIGLQGIAKLTSLYGDRAIATSMVGYWDSKTKYFFEGISKGRIVSPRGNGDFGWGKIFVPEGYEQTFAEMGRRKFDISMRSIAFNKLKEHIGKENE